MFDRVNYKYSILITIEKWGFIKYIKPATIQRIKSF